MFSEEQVNQLHTEALDLGYMEEMVEEVSGNHYNRLTDKGKDMAMLLSTLGFYTDPSWMAELSMMAMKVAMSPMPPEAYMEVDEDGVMVRAGHREAS